MATHQKVLLEYAGSTPDQLEVESVWAVPVDGAYRIDNIPFYAQGIALGDLVAVSQDEDGMLRFRSLVLPSGHSTVRLWFPKDSDSNKVMEVRNQLRGMGCPSEVSDIPRLVAVDIPPSVSYKVVRQFLDEHEKLGAFEFEEACLGQ